MCLLPVFPYVPNKNLDNFFETSECVEEKGNFINGYSSLYASKFFCFSCTTFVLHLHNFHVTLFRFTVDSVQSKPNPLIEFTVLKLDIQLCSRIVN